MSDEFLQNLSSKMDKISEDITEIKVTAAKQEVSLSEHIKRTAILEDSVEFLYDEIRPIKTHVGQVNAVFKVIGLVTSILSVLVAIAKLFHWV